MHSMQCKTFFHLMIIKDIYRTHSSLRELCKPGNDD